MNFKKLAEWLRENKDFEDWKKRNEVEQRTEYRCSSVLAESKHHRTWGPCFPSLGNYASPSWVMLNVLIKSTQVALCLHSQDHGGEQGHRGTRPSPGSPAVQAAATLLELLCSPLFVKSSLYCPLCYIPVKSDLIILLFRSLHDLRYSVKVLINL